MASQDQGRQITESRVLSAMAHPLRRRLLDVLKVNGPSTVTTLALQTDQAIPNISHHVRVLAEAGLVETAPELARNRRERWWRLTSSQFRWSTSDFAGDPAAEALAAELTRMNLRHHWEVVQRWNQESDQEREGWGEAPFMSEMWLHLTPSELERLGQEVLAVFKKWETDSPHTDEARKPVFVFAIGVPGRP